MTAEQLRAEMVKIASRVAQTLDTIPAAFDAKRKRREKLEETIAVALETTYRFAELQGGELGIMIGARDAAVRTRTGTSAELDRAKASTWGDRVLARLGLVRLGKAREAVWSVPVPPTLPAQALALARRMRDDAKKKASQK